MAKAHDSRRPKVVQGKEEVRVAMEEVRGDGEGEGKGVTERVWGRWQ